MRDAAVRNKIRKNEMKKVAAEGIRIDIGI